jgi:hypothetical protein
MRKFVIIEKRISKIKIETGVIRSCISKKDRHCNIQNEKEQKDKQLYTKHYTSS